MPPIWPPFPQNARSCGIWRFAAHPWQEFRHHGVKLQGPCKKLKSAGHKGAHTGNIQRDMLRTVHGLNDMGDVSFLKLVGADIIYIYIYKYKYIIYIYYKTQYGQGTPE